MNQLETAPNVDLKVNSALQERVLKYLSYMAVRIAKEKRCCLQEDVIEMSPK